LADECIVQNNLVHRPGPDQERVRGVGSAKITVTATFYDEAEIVGPSEVNSGNDVVCSLCGDGINTGRRHPGVDPTGALGRTRLIADVERVLQVFDYSFSSCDVCGDVSGHGWFDLNQPAIDRLFQLFPTRFVGPIGIRGTHS
jgi:hypothetical protein